MLYHINRKCRAWTPEGMMIEPPKALQSLGLHHIFRKPIPKHRWRCKENYEPRHQYVLTDPKWRQLMNPGVMFGVALWVLKGG